MTAQLSELPNIQYDRRNDILYLMLRPGVVSVVEDLAPGLFLRIDEKTDVPVGVDIMDYSSRNEDSLKQIPPKVDWDSIRREVY